MADNIITPDAMPRAMREALAVDHARHGTCFYRWRPDDEAYERIAPVAKDAAAFAYAQATAFMEDGPWVA